MPIFEFRPAVVERTRPPFGLGAVAGFGGNLIESGFGMSNPTLPGPDRGSQAGGRVSCGTSPVHGGGCACGFG
jgi:hypothetical protein